MVIPAWLIKRLSIGLAIILWVVAAKGYFPGDWYFLAFALNITFLMLFLRTRDIHIAAKKENG